MIIEIPLRNDLPAYKLQVDIEEITYTLYLSFNLRANHWTLNIADIDQNMIVAGIPLITGWDLLRQYKTNPKLPKGELMMIDTAGENKIADTEDLGERVILLYQEAS